MVNVNNIPNFKKRGAQQSKQIKNRETRKLKTFLIKINKAT